MTDLSPEEQALADKMDSLMGGRLLDDLRCFDKDGQRISYGTYAALRTRGKDDPYGNWYARVAHDIVGLIEISTVWLGQDHGFWAPEGYDGPIAIFETMVFARPDKPGEDVTELTNRYPDQGSALLGHQAIVQLAREHPDVPSFLEALREIG